MAGTDMAARNSCWRNFRKSFWEVRLKVKKNLKKFLRIRKTLDKIERKGE